MRADNKATHPESKSHDAIVSTGSTGLLFFFMMYIVWRFGHVRLGLPGTEHEPPEFSTGAYICLIFTGALFLHLPLHWLY
jgi:choline-glycine betaine transporter